MTRREFKPAFDDSDGCGEGCFGCGADVGCLLFLLGGGLFGEGTQWSHLAPTARFVLLYVQLPAIGLLILWLLIRWRRKTSAATDEDDETPS